MELLTTIQQLHDLRARLRAQGETLALVPTMGALHAGHLSLIELARREAKRTIVSIFVNPLQFNNPEDLAKYPRPLEADLQKIERLDVAAVFLPTIEEIYPRSFLSQVEVGALGDRWEGASRPGHFRGVTTVVSILFNLVAPQVAIFGEKDFQQLRIIEQLNRDLHFGIRIVRAPLVREPDGLAMSSRNVRLSPEARQAALALSRALFVMRDAFRGGQRDANFLRNLGIEQISLDPLVKLDYCVLVEEERLTPLEGTISHARIMLAAAVGGVRLLDTIQI